MHDPSEHQSPTTNDKGEKLTKEGVESSIGTIHNNIQRQLKDKKFQDAFTPNYGGIQRGLLKQMKKIDNREETISKDLKATKNGISNLKKPKGPGILGLLLGSVGKFVVFALGALILIGLIRFAFKKWREAYMPKVDPKDQMTIFGFKIPGWSTIKAFAIGIRNWIVVGLPNWWNRIKSFVSGVKKALFGRKGALRDLTETKNTLRKIIMAWMIGATKKVGGWVMWLLGAVLSVIPFVGPIGKFLMKFGPMVYSFVATQVMLIWSNNKANAERTLALNLKSQTADTRNSIS
jgi:nicotinamide riboside transporter PnuC